MELTIGEVQEIVKDILRNTIEICDKNNITYYAQAGTVLGAIRHKGMIPWDHDADLVVPNNEINRFAEVLSRELPEKYYVDFPTVRSGSKRSFPRIGLKGYSTDDLHIDIFRLIGLPDERNKQEAHLLSVKPYERAIKMLRVFDIKRVIKSKDYKLILSKLGLSKKNIDYYIGVHNELCDKIPYDEANYVANPSGKYGTKNIFKKEIYGEGKIVNFEDFKIRIPSEYDFYLKQYYNDYMKTPSKEYIDEHMNKRYIVG